MAIASSQELTTYGAAQLARLIASRELSSREVVEAHIRRIEAVNPRINAVTVPLFDRALDEATAADASPSTRPLHGVPITIKDQFLVEGVPCSIGLPSRAGLKEQQDGPLVRRLRAAGGIVLGVTNVPQLLIYHESDNPLYGRANNPWNLDRTPGGSSGGEAAVVAAHGSPLGLGGDIGGSLRVPAHFCGLHTLKPTSGRLTGLDLLSRVFAEGQEGILAQAGPLARTVEDVELGLRILCQPDPDDPALPPVPWPTERPSIETLRVGVFSHDGFFPAAPAVRRAVDAAAAALSTMRVHVEPFTPPSVEQAIALYFGILGADGGAWARRTLGSNPRDRRVKGLLQVAGIPNAVRGGVVRAAMAAGQRRLAQTIASLKPRSAGDYWEQIAARTRYRADFIAAMDAQRLDALICPAHALPALTHGSSYYLTTAGSYSILFNLLGMPAGAVAATRVRAGEESDRPATRDIVERTARVVERDSVGLPIGVQVASRYWREDVALSLMAALETHFRRQPDYTAAPAL